MRLFPVACFVIVACGGGVLMPPERRVLLAGPGEEGGSRECEPFVDPYPPNQARTDDHPPDVVAYYASRAGCVCTGNVGQDGSCGSFPCTKDGCYVRRCQVDAQCGAGLCSSYASWPHGYCVTDDPH